MIFIYLWLIYEVHLPLLMKLLPWVCSLHWFFQYRKTYQGNYTFYPFTFDFILTIETTLHAWGGRSKKVRAFVLQSLKVPRLYRNPPPPRANPPAVPSTLGKTRFSTVMPSVTGPVKLDWNCIVGPEIMLLEIPIILGSNEFAINVMIAHRIVWI